MLMSLTSTWLWMSILSRETESPGKPGRFSSDLVQGGWSATCRDSLWSWTVFWRLGQVEGNRNRARIAWQGSC